MNLLVIVPPVIRVLATRSRELECPDGADVEKAMQVAQGEGDNWQSGAAGGALFQTVPAVFQHNRGGPN